MKKRVMVSILVLFGVILLILWGLSKTNYASRLESNLGVKIPYNATIEFEDDHDNFHGDGTTFAKVVFPKDAKGISADICESNRNWRPLPLPTELSLLIFGGENYGYNDERMKPAQRTVKGFYFFEDRFSEEYGAPSESFVERLSHNYTFAIYDSQQHILYYYKSDS